MIEMFSRFQDPRTPPASFSSLPGCTSDSCGIPIVEAKNHHRSAVEGNLRLKRVEVRSISHDLESFGMIFNISQSGGFFP